MIPIDTNIVVRLLVNDDKAQADRAQALVENNDVLITTPVLLETEWVLRSSYGISARSFITGLEKLLGFPTVAVEALGVIAEALRLHGQGVDFADAVHLAAAGASGRFATFDKGLIRAARRLQLAIDVFEP